MTQRAPPPGDGVHFLPVRHHSPTCALALRRCFDEVRPVNVLVEAPIDFEPLLPALTDARTTPPVAIVSIGEDEQDRSASIYPFCRHSPEFVAVNWARANGGRVMLIDLPARNKAMRGRGGPDGPDALISNDRLDYNAYVSALAERRGVADGAALWDALFEGQGPEVDWRAYFAAVGLYCEHIREVTDPASVGSDLAREAHMAARLHEAVAAGGVTAVVTGGFHTPALRDALAGPAPPPVKAASAAPAYLIRYGFQQLDQRDGYGAGLPHPAWYDRLWAVLDQGGDTGAMAMEAMTDFADHLRRNHPSQALSTPVTMQAGLAARRLAALRDLAYPGRNEVFDGLISAGVKEALEIGRTPLISAFSDFLSGDMIGDLPPGAAQPPIVEAVRHRARTLRFTLEGGERRTRDLDVLRKPRHAEASRFLFALDFVGAPFARRIGGPDPFTGWQGEVLIETWTYAWSPMVESRLIALAIDGVTLDQVARAEMLRKREHLAKEGLARSSSRLAALLVTAARMGFDALSLEVLGWCVGALMEDPEVASITRALSLTAGVALHGGAALAEPCRAWRAQAFERLILLFPHIARTPPDRLPELIAALGELAVLARDEDASIDGDALSAAVLAQPVDMPPALTGALAAFAGLIGALSEAQVAERLNAAMSGTYVEPGARAAALTGCLSINPRLLIHSDALRAAADGFLSELDTEAFMDVLPELRLALGKLSPSEIDEVAQWVARRHGLARLEVNSSDIPADETAANLRLSDRLQTLWAADGLGDWLGAET